MNWHCRDIHSIATDLLSNADSGLAFDEATERLARYGPNELIDRGGKSPWRILWEQFTSTMSLILTAAATASALIGSPRDSITILAIVVLFALLGFFQEYRAERAMRSLKRMAAPSVRVRRDGAAMELPSTLLVPGDLVLLEAGNIVPADCRVFEASNLRIQESLLTGESEPVEKQVNVLDNLDLGVADRTNMVFMGTTVSYGRGVGMVVATGMATELGAIAEMLQQVVEEWTPLQRRLAQLGSYLAVVSIVIAALIFVIGVLRGENLREMLMTAVSVAVAAIPEGLPAVVTITLAIGAQRMLRRKALIRRLPAVETLGSVTVICTDKTGTLTENRMTVTALVTLADITDDSGRNHHEILLTAAALCNDAELREDDSAVGDPTESALLIAAAAKGLYRQSLETMYPRISEIPFDSAVKRMVTTHSIRKAPSISSSPGASLAELGDREGICIAKGALDAILALCSQVVAADGVRRLDASLTVRFVEAADRLAANGQRVLAVASGPTATRGQPENLVLLGLVAMMDPPRQEATSAVQSCISAGIRPVMITGDHPLTARAIASSVGFGASPRIITGADIDALADYGLVEAVRETSIFARVSPEHKLLIVEALQKNGEVVAMTGDGVNDAPALKKADIGVAMGAAGTDVAREAADMVLLNDNFATIVSAVEEGRTIYDNIRKFIVFSVSGNLGKILAVLLLPFFGLPIPLTPLQLLWLNLLTDGLLGLGMGVERSEPDIMSRPPIAPSAGIFDRRTVLQVLVAGCAIGITTMTVTMYFWSRQPLHPDENWQTILFTSLVCAQIGQAMALRSFRHSFFRMGLFGNPVLLAMAVSVVLLQILVVYMPVLRPWFRTTPMGIDGILSCIAPGLVVFCVLEIYKYLNGPPKQLN